MRLDGRAKLIVRGGDVARVWKVLETVTVETIDVEAEPKLTKRQLTELMGATVYGQSVPAPVQAVSVAEAQAAIVLFDGAVMETVGPGRYGYWQVGRKVTSLALDTRPAPLEVTAQEILTKDRVSIRVTLTSFVQVTDVEKAALSTPGLRGARLQAGSVRGPRGRGGPDFGRAPQRPDQGRPRDRRACP